MPYPEKFAKTLRAIKHGWKPRRKDLREIGRREAHEMLSEAGQLTKDGEEEGRRRAIRRIRKRRPR